MSFYERANVAIANRHLRQAIANGTEWLHGARKGAFGELGADGETYRRRGRAIRERGFERLAEYLEQFVTQAKKNGAQVHFAGDAQEASSIVLQIAKERDCKLAIKMKSMLTEEIHLGKAFEDEGLRAVETDLGEWILQLAKETPSHLIVPALHKQKTDIKQLFDEHLGRDDRPNSEEPSVLVERGRVALRDQFLKADLGITGVNFAVAESGTLVLVSNEGNGRLVTAGPPIHIALVPIEKVVPTLAEAVTLVKLLTWSAIGRITTYVSWITGPRREKELDGPRELHIVLVDNGRSAALGGPLEEALYCIRCSACLNICPVYRRVGGHTYDSVYSGPIGIGLTPIVRGQGKDTDELAHASSLCGACEEVCPVQIDIPRLILESRKQSVSAHRIGLLERLAFVLYSAIIRRPWLYRLALRMGRGVSQLFAKDRWIEHAPGLGAWTRSRSLRALDRESFRQRFARRSKPRGR